MDVASLGLEVQSADVVKATGDLNKLSVAAAQAEANAAKLNRQKIGVEGTHAAARAAQNLAKAEEQAAKALGNRSREEMDALRAARQMANAHAASTRAALERARAEDTLAASQARAANAALREAQAQKRLDDAMRPRNPVNDNDPIPGSSPGATRANNANILAQFQDIGVTAAGGMAPLTIALQQGTQLAAVLSSMEKPLAGLIAGFAGLFGAISLLTIGLIALVAWGLQMVNWIDVLNTGVKFLQQNIQTIIPVLAALGAVMLVAFGPQIIGGLLSLTAFTLGFAAAATYAGVTAAAAWLIALGPITLLVAAIAGIGVAIWAFNDDIKNAIGIDLVEAMKVAGNVLIAVFMGTVDGIVATFTRLPGALGDIMIMGVNAQIKAVEIMLNTIIGLVNSFVGSINDSISKLPGWAGGNLQLGTVGKVSFTQVSNPWEGAAADVGKTILDSIDKASKTDWLGTIGKGIGDASDYAGKKLKELSGWLDKVGDKDKKKKKGGGKTDAEKYEDITKGAERRIASLQAEYDSIGMTAEATARLKYETELLNQAQQKGLTLTSAQRAELADYAAKMATIEEKTRKAKEQFDFAKSATRGFLGDLKQGLLDGESLWEAFGNAAMNVLDKIVDKLLDDVVNALFQVNSSVGGSGGGGFLGAIFGGLFGGSKSAFPSAPGGLYANGGAFSSGVQKFAKGGTFTNSIVNSPTLFKFAQGTGLMGEAGPEAIMPLSRDSNGKLGVSVNGKTGPTAAPQGGSSSLRVSLSPDLVAQVLEQAGNQSVEIVKENNRANAELRKNGGE